MQEASLVLASASETRSLLLRRAGVAFVRDPADVDEAAIKASCRHEGKTAEETALALAIAKAETVSRRHRNKPVIGSDQLLDCDGRWFDKPPDQAAAKTALQALQGRNHRLVTAVCVVEAGVVAWEHVSSPMLTMRALSDDDVTHYLAAAGESILATVGGYRIEGLGIHLFSRVEGDHFSILGLPLVPLLGYLRSRGVIGPSGFPR